MTTTAPVIKSGSFLSRVTRGFISRPQKIMIYGQPGVGKTSVAGSAPSPIFLQTEDGADGLSVARFPRPEKWSEVGNMTQELIDNETDMKTFVGDTLDGLEALLFAHVCAENKKDSIEKVMGGYGKGFTRAVELWREYLAQLERLQQKRGMTIVLLAHSTLKLFNNPEGADYDRYIPKMNEKAWGAIYGWCDVVLFAQFETALKDEGEDKSKAKTTGARFLRTTKSAAWEAKNRHGMPHSLPLLQDDAWRPIAEALEAPTRLRNEITLMLGGIKDARYRAAIEAWMNKIGNNAIELAAGLEKLKQRIAETTETKLESKEQAS